MNFRLRSWFFGVNDGNGFLILAQLNYMNDSIFMNIFEHRITFLGKFLLIHNELNWAFSLLLNYIFKPSNTLIWVDFNNLRVHFMISEVASDWLNFEKHVFFLWVLGYNKSIFLWVIWVGINVSNIVDQTFLTNSK